MSESQYTYHPGRRVFAAEFNDGTHTYSESDEDRSPNFQLLPTGVRANRVLVMGTITEVEDVASDPDTEFLRARLVGPTGTFLVYAGQYQPEAASVLRDLETPSYMAVSGKIRTYEPESEDGEDDDDTTIVSIRPDDFLVEVDADRRDMWIRETAAQTLDRIEGSDSENPLVAKAIDQYGTQPAEYTSCVIDALESLEVE